MKRSFYFSSSKQADHNCFCGLIHVRSAVFVLALIQLLCLSYSAISVPLAYAHVTRESWNLITISFFTLTFIGGVVAALTMLGMVGEHPKLLIPQILWLIVCGFLSCVLVTVASVAMVEGGWMAHEVFGSQKWVINWEGVNDVVRVIVSVLIVLSVNLIIIIASVWLVRIVAQCSRYIKEKVEFEERMLNNLPRREEMAPINSNEPHY